MSRIQRVKEYGVKVSNSVFSSGERERVALSDIGNCDISAELKISLVNEMKQNKNFPRPKG